MTKIKYIAVEWIDAMDNVDIYYNDIISNPTSKYTIKRVAYGILGKEDKDGIVIITDKDCNDKCEITTIPKKMLVNIK